MYYLRYRYESIELTVHGWRFLVGKSVNNCKNKFGYRWRYYDIRNMVLLRTTNSPWSPNVDFRANIPSSFNPRWQEPLHAYSFELILILTIRCLLFRVCSISNCKSIRSVRWRVNPFQNPVVFKCPSYSLEHGWYSKHRAHLDSTGIQPGVRRHKAHSFIQAM